MKNVTIQLVAIPKQHYRVFNHGRSTGLNVSSHKGPILKDIRFGSQKVSYFPSSMLWLDIF